VNDQLKLDDSGAAKISFLATPHNGSPEYGWMAQYSYL
jgi:hypothetical protein